MLRLFAPGKRGKYWVIKGSYLGQEIERSAQTYDRHEAEQYKHAIEREIQSFTDGATARITFREATDRYMEWRRSEKGNMPARDRQWLEGICALIGDRELDSIRKHDVVNIANIIYPNAKAATKNRAILRPLAAVVHYAADNEWCSDRRFKAFEEPPPVTRNADPRDEAKLLQAVGDSLRKRILIMWLFRQGNRITETLGAEMENVDFRHLNVKIWSGKTKEWITFPLDPEIAASLKKLAKESGMIAGRIFPWKTRFHVYAWLKPLCKELGITFTPHMARHAVGKRFSDSGASLRSTMTKLGHRSEKSSMRYQAPDLEVVRKISRKMKVI